MPIQLRRFLGLLPRTPPSLLPVENATQASNCDFAYGELRSTRADLYIKPLANAARSIYTDNGLTFYSWPVDVNAVRSPLANDQYDRLYYTTDTDFRVTSRSGMRANGGEPASSYRVGVPRPNLAPVLAQANMSPLHNAVLTATFHYEFAGVKYQEQAINLLTVTAEQKWTFTPPASNYTPPVRNPETGQYSAANPAETPANAIPVVRLSARHASGNLALDVYSSNSALNTERLWVLALSKTGTAGDYSISLTAMEDESLRETRAYAYTYVNTYGEEGPPSPPATISLMPMLAASVGVQRDVQTADYAPIKEIRIYRTPGTADIAEYFYLGSIAVLGESGRSFDFVEQADSVFNESLASQDSHPPHPLLRGLLALPNGILMAYKGNELHFSDAYRPWSWPPSYVKTLGDFQIVGAIAVGSGALVTTTGKPFLISGIAPDAMTEASLNIWQAGVSKWALADLGGQIVYASHDGLVTYDGGLPNLSLSQRYFTREVWRTKYAAGLASMRFAVWDGRLLVYCANASFTAIMLSLDEAQGAMTELPDLQANCSFTSPLADQCYLVRGNGLYQFAGGELARASWTSREIVLPAMTNFAVAKVVCSGTWQIQLYADGVLRHTQGALNGNQTFRLPGGFCADRWQIALQGTGVLRELYVAAHPRELAAL